MFQYPYLSGVFNVLALMAVLALVETVMPLFPHSVLNRRHLEANLGLTAITFGLNFLMNGFLMTGALWVSGHGAGLIQWADLPLPWAITVTVTVMDLATYAVHVLMHKVPVLWRAHLVHHCDPALDVTTTFRQHPIESLLRYVFLILTAWGWVHHWGASCCTARCRRLMRCSSTPTSKFPGVWIPRYRCSGSLPICTSCITRGRRRKLIQTTGIFFLCLTG